MVDRAYFPVEARLTDRLPWGPAGHVYSDADRHHAFADSTVEANVLRKRRQYMGTLICERGSFLLFPLRHTEGGTVGSPYAGSRRNDFPAAASAGGLILAIFSVTRFSGVQKLAENWI